MVPTLLRVMWRRHALERSCGWTRAQLEQHQQRRLIALRRFVLESSPFYRRFHHGLENQPLNRLPILTKVVMMEEFDDLVTDRSVRLADAEAFLSHNPGEELFQGRYVVLSTSGSTGYRGIFLYDRGEWLTALAMIMRPFMWADISGGWAWPPRTAAIASTTPWHYSARASASMMGRLSPVLRLDASESLPALVERLNQWQPEVLIVYPSILRPLADAQIAGRLHIRPRSVSTSAEVLTDDTRQLVQRAWGVRVFDTYGATEYAPIATECVFGRKHLFEDGAFIEIVDGSGQPVPPGARGERLLLTIFDRRTQPLIRYEISDIVRGCDGGCNCGRPFGWIDAVEGRIEEILYFRRRDNGSERVPVHPVVFRQLLDNVPASGWQVQQDADGLSIMVAGLQDPSNRERLASSVRQALDERGASVGTIRVCAVEVLPRGATGKAAQIVSKTQK